MKRLYCSFFMIKIILLLLFTYNNLLAETTSEFFNDFSDKINIRTSIGMREPNLGIDYQDKKFKDNDDVYIQYEPNHGMLLSFDVSYRDFGFSFSKALSPNDENIYGKTKYTNFQIYYYATKYGLDLFYQDFEGFYLMNPEKYGYQEGDPDTKRSDLKLFNVGANFYYNIFSNWFSLKSTFNQTERQNKCGGSILIMTSVMQSTIGSDYSLIPPLSQHYYNKYSGFYSADMNSLGLSIGGAYTITLFNLYVTPMLFLGKGYMFKEYKTGSETIKDNGAYYKFNPRLSIGYNGDSVFYGLLFSADFTSTENIFSDEGGFSVTAGVHIFEIFCGLRF